MTECQQPQLWLPSHDSEPHFDTPTIEELTAAWVDREQTEVLALPDEIYGVAEKPHEQPTAVVSIDLCEVVRETGLSVIELRGGTLDDMVADGQTGEMDYGSTINGWTEETAQAERQKIIQHLMHHGHVRPTAYAESIAAFLRKWQQQGVYVIANTSTLPGCELSTMRFLEAEYLGCFRGILFPRNHDDKGKVTKAMSLNAIVDAIGREVEQPDRPPLIAIDDAMHHAHDLHATGAHVFVPAYAWNEAFDDHESISRIERTLGTVDTFVATDQRITELLRAESTSA